MAKKFLFLISFVLVIGLASVSYGTDARAIKVDINYVDDNNEPNTQAGFTAFTLEESGSEVNNITLDIFGNIQAARRDSPNGFYYPEGDPCAVYYPRAGEKLYRDFVFGIVGNGINVQLYGLGTNRDCNVTLWSYDYESTDGGRRGAEWYSLVDGGPSILIFDANFEGGEAGNPRYEYNHPEDLYLHAHSAIITTDDEGKILLTCQRADYSPAGQPFAYLNAIVVEPNESVAYVPPEPPQRPIPRNGQEDVTVNSILKWNPGASSEKRDVYLGTNFNDVNEANRPNPKGVRIALNQDANSIDPYGLLGFLKMDETYYWRVDEVNTSPSPTTIVNGDVWSFTTPPYSLVDNYEPYLNNDALRAIWSEPVATRAVLYSSDTISHGVEEGRSMEYDYLNYSSPYYSEVVAELAAGELEIDSDWETMKTKSLSVWFYGQEENDANEQMYLKLSDDTNVVKVNYPTMSDIREEEWHEWNIPMTTFASVDLGNVTEIAIGFGDGNNPGADPNGYGIVYFDDFQIFPTRCALSERSANFALVDFASDGGTGDCIIDQYEIDTMSDGWLAEDAVIETHNPGDTNLVLYYPLNEVDGNKIYPDPCDPYDPKWRGTLYNNSLDEPGNAGSSFATPGAPDIGGAGCLYFNGDYGTVVSCGSTYGELDLGIGGGNVYASDHNAMTLSCWTRWLGNRDWDLYLATKSQGILGKRGGWNDERLVWMLEADTGGQNRSLGLRHYGIAGETRVDLYAANNRMLTELNRWAHIAATYDGNTATLYINGGPVNSGPWRFSNGDDPNIFLTIGNTMDINAWPANCPEAYYGYIDEVRIYNRALEPNEVAYLADRTPLDGVLQIPVPSVAEIYEGEPEGERVVNFKDFALVANKWLTEYMYPYEGP